MRICAARAVADARTVPARWNEVGPSQSQGVVTGWQPISRLSCPWSSTVSLGVLQTTAVWLVVTSSTIWAESATRSSTSLASRLARVPYQMPIPSAPRPVIRLFQIVVPLVL